MTTTRSDSDKAAQEEVIKQELIQRQHLIVLVQNSFNATALSNIPQRANLFNAILAQLQTSQSLSLKDLDYLVASAVSFNQKVIELLQSPDDVIKTRVNSRLQRVYPLLADYVLQPSVFELFATGALARLEKADGMDDKALNHTPEAEIIDRRSSVELSLDYLVEAKILKRDPYQKGAALDLCQLAVANAANYAELLQVCKTLAEMKDYFKYAKAQKNFIYSFDQRDHWQLLCDGVSKKTTKFFARITPAQQSRTKWEALENILKEPLRDNPFLDPKARERDRKSISFGCTLN